MIKQRTIKQTASAVGIGLHSGRKVKLLMRPAPPDTGIVFRRVDITPAVDLPSRAEAVNDTRLATTLNEGKVIVSTIEHLMSALNGLGIDNLIVEVDAPEIPIMDGSGATFVYLIRSAGILEQPVPRRFVRVKKTIEVRDGDKWARLEPHNGMVLDLRLLSVIRRLTRPCSMPWWIWGLKPMSKPSVVRALSASCPKWSCSDLWDLPRAARLKTLS